MSALLYRYEFLTTQRLAASKIRCAITRNTHLYRL